VKPCKANTRQKVVDVFWRIARYVGRPWTWPASLLEARGLRVVVCVIAGVLSMVLAIGLMVFTEHRTNLTARAVGRLMAATNSLRRPDGAAWTQIVAQDSVGASLEARPAQWSGAEGSLPEAVAGARFEVDRDTPGGLPRSLDIYRIPLTEADRRRREGPEVVRSLSTYTTGLRILRIAWLPDSRFARRAADEADAVLRASDLPQSSGFEIPDITGVGLPDSSDDAIKARLVGEEIDRLRVRDRQKLTDDFQAGLIYHISVGWGLGRYEGQVEYDDPATPRVSFELSLSDLSQALTGPQAAR
jgi:hypothetical protein